MFNSSRQKKVNKITRSYIASIGLGLPVIKNFRCKKCGNIFDVYSHEQVRVGNIQIYSIVGRTYKIRTKKGFKCPECKSGYERFEREVVKVK